MAKKWRLPLLLTVLLLVGFAPHSDESPDTLQSKRRLSMDHFGTVSRAVVYDDFDSLQAVGHFNEAWDAIRAELTHLESTLSVDAADSDIARFNEAEYGDTIAVQPVTAKLIAVAQEVHEQTGGAYNPAVKHLVDLWGFSPRTRSSDFSPQKPYDRTRNPDGSFDLPDERYIDAFRQLADFSGVILEGSEEDGYMLTKAVPCIELDGVRYSLSLDMGGIAKGYAAERGGAVLEEHGYSGGLMDVGSSSLQLLKRHVSVDGAPEEHMWGVRVGDPDGPSELYATAFASNAAVATSGTYLRRYTVDGREYSHIIDPRTGEPTTSSIVSVTMIGEDAAYIDAVSTALVVLPQEEAIALMEQELADWDVLMLARPSADGEPYRLITNMHPDEYIVH